jgi:DNA-binding SARP family transcriptional activator/pimeloyl-ACP methyl ester carboxylesterase
MEDLSLRLLGAPQVAYGGNQVSLRLHKELALLIYLAVTSRPQTRMALATILWPDHDERNSLASLRRTIYQLKMDIGESVLEITSNLVRLRPDVPLWLDTQRFSNALRHCKGHEHPPDAPLASCVAMLEDGVKLYSDDFLSGFSLPDSEAFDEWQFFEREGLRTEYVRVLALLTTYYEQHETYDKAIETARLWLGREPYYEPAHRALIRLYAVTGQQAAAKRQYETCKRVLAGLGVQLDPETERLYQSLGDSTGGSTSRPQAQYTRNGDVYLAYETLGAGAVDVLQIGGFITHVEQDWEEPDLARFYRRLSTAARVILYDKRGVGLSDRIGAPATIEQQVADAEAVIRAAGSERVIILAVSDGATVAIPLAMQYPELVSGLVIYGGQAKGVRSAEYPWGLTPEQYQRWAERLVSGWGGPVNLEYFAPTRAQDERLRLWWAQMQRLASSPSAVKTILEGIRNTDVRALLEHIRAPTLILHRRGDRCVPVESGRYLAAHIQQARYVELPGDDHWWWVGDTRPLHDEIERFIRSFSPPSMRRRRQKYTL